jgi:transposase-like protein
MTKQHRYFPVEAKRAAVLRVEAGEAVSAIARDIGATRGRLYAWYHKYQEGGVDGLRPHGRPRKGEVLSARARSWREAPDESAAPRQHIAELERKIGQQQVDLDFFRKALRHVEETRRAQAAPGAAASTKSSKR